MMMTIMNRREILVNIIEMKMNNKKVFVNINQDNDDRDDDDEDIGDVTMNKKKIFVMQIEMMVNKKKDICDDDEQERYL